MDDRPAPKRRRGWLFGCGLGCAALLVALLVFGAVFISRVTRGLDESIAAARQQEERFGAPEAFTPPPDGSIPPDRLAAFLAVRDALEGPRLALQETFDRMPIGRLRQEQLEAMPFTEKLTTMLSAGRSALGLGPAIGEFYGARDRAMLDAGMGMGEYAYIYTIAYHSWLGHDPTDGPRTDPYEKSEGGSQEFRVMAAEVLSRVRADLIRILRNQLDALPPGASDAWRADLAAEIQAMEREAGRTPWQGRVPPAIAASLEPERPRLEASYRSAANPFELARPRKKRPGSYTSD